MGWWLLEFCVSCVVLSLMWGRFARFGVLGVSWFINFVFAFVEGFGIIYVF